MRQLPSTSCKCNHEHSPKLMQLYLCEEKKDLGELQEFGIRQVLK